MKVSLLLSAAVVSFSIFSIFSTAGCTVFDVDIDVMGPRGPLKESTLVPGETYDKVLLLDVDGIITSSGRRGMLSRSESPVARLKERLKKARKDPCIKAIVLRVNSPGGTVTASDIMYEELRRFREETGIPIVACLMDLATSGAYYVSMSADKIVCHPTCITGSIGVIAQMANFDKMLEKLGIEPVTIKSGKHKDIGSPFREATAEEKEIMRKLVQGMYARFVEVVAAGRGMKREKVRKLADGRVYDAKQALKLKLVDEIGYLDDAIELAQKEARIEGASVVMYRKPTEFRTNIYSARSAQGGSLLVEELFGRLSARFLYLWVPGKVH